MNIVAMMERWMLCTALITWTSTQQGWPVYTWCWVPNHPAAETNTEPQIWCHPLEWPASDWVVVSYIRPLLFMERVMFVLTGVDIYSGYRFSFPAYNASLFKLLSINTVYTASLLTKELISQPEKCDSILNIMDITGHTVFLIILKH